jgi:Tol biopolymer transport system component/DNA-binding winged helix-turn-helix (wHTH) protein
MERIEEQASLVRFGSFEADLAREDLRRDGRAIPIQQQPFRVLATLLERPGEIVTREELRERLWPDDLHVDFEHGLNTAIKKVRFALHDSPDHPRFVETVRGRGYRFVAPVERIEPQEGGEPRPGASAGRRLRWLTIGLAGTALAVVIASLTAIDSRRDAERSPRVVPLTSYPGMEYQATFSPDGSHVAFVWCHDGNHDVYVQPVGVLKPSPLAEEPELEHSPAWSPDGRWIAFIRDPAEPEGRARVLVKPPFAGEERLVTQFLGQQDQAIWQRQIAWTPDSRHLVLSRPDDHGATWSLYFVDVKSGAMRRLTESPARDSAPAVSADGRSLAFSRRVGDRGEIYVLSLGRDFTPAGRPRPLVGQDLLRKVPLDAGYMPGWTRDGLEIVFAGFPRGPRLFRVGASGTPRVRRIQATGELLLDPALCPRTGRLAYTNWVAVQSIVRLDIGSGLDAPASPVSFNSTRSDGEPCFSPDGRTVAFRSTRLGAPAIWLSRPDGSGLRRLTPPAGDDTWCGEPAWSPDGQWIAYAEIGPRRADIHVISVLGGVPRRLTFDPAEDREPAWSPDGQWVYFVSKRDGGPRVWRKPWAGGAPECVSSVEGTQPTLSPDGRFLFARGWPNEQEVWRMPVDGGPAEIVLKSVNLSRWWMGPSGLYFFGRPSPGGRIDLFRYELDSGDTQRLAVVEEPVGAGLTVSPDEKTALFAKLDQRQADLRMLESFASD